MIGWLVFQRLAKQLGTEPLIVDVATESTPACGFPIGGQTVVNMKNDHFNYALTW